MRLSIGPAADGAARSAAGRPAAILLMAHGGPATPAEVPGFIRDMLGQRCAGWARGGDRAALPRHRRRLTAAGHRQGHRRLAGAGRRICPSTWACATDGPSVGEASRRCRGRWDPSSCGRVPESAPSGARRPAVPGVRRAVRPVARPGARCSVRGQLASAARVRGGGGSGDQGRRESLCAGTPRRGLRGLQRPQPADGRSAERTTSTTAGSRESASGVAGLLGLPADRWCVAYQSAPAPGPRWLGPHLRDIIAALASRRERDVVVVPLGFVADSLEVLYDIDLELTRFAAGCGVHLERAPLLNDGPALVDALKGAVLEALAGDPMHRRSRREHAPRCASSSGRPRPTATCAACTAAVSTGSRSGRRASSRRRGRWTSSTSWPRCRPVRCWCSPAASRCCATTSTRWRRMRPRAGWRSPWRPTRRSSHRDTAARIAKDGIRRVSVSLDGADAETHDAFRSVPGSFAAALAGIAALRAAGVPLQINTTVSRHNLGQLEQMLALAGELGAVALHLFLLVPVGCGMKIAEDEQISAGEYERVLRWLHEARGARAGAAAPRHLRAPLSARGAPGASRGRCTTRRDRLARPRRPAGGDARDHARLHAGVPGRHRRLLRLTRRQGVRVRLSARGGRRPGRARRWPRSGRPVRSSPSCVPSSCCAASATAATTSRSAAAAAPGPTA